MTATPIRVLLIDDHTLFRSGLRSLLKSSPDFEVIAEAGDGHLGIRLAVQHRPDVILLDNNMPGLPGSETARRILAEAPGLHILMLTVSEEVDDLLDSLRAGASGYLLKNINADTLMAAIISAAQGESILSPQMMTKLLTSIRSAHLPPKMATTSPAAPTTTSATVAITEDDKLTPREREILHHLARGESNKEIARTLDVAESTVKIHVQNLLRKLGLNSRVQAAVYAVEHGFTTPPA